MRSRSCDDCCIGQRLVEALGPILNVVVVDWASLSWLDLLGLLFGHCGYSAGGMFRVKVETGGEEGKRNDRIETNE
jgi:hypothetical protein